MPDFTEEQLTENLRQANTRLSACLESLETIQDYPTPSPQLISELLSELLRTGAWLRDGLPEDRSLQLQTEVGEYRRNLARLRDQMPAIHSHLLQERARLEAERTRIELALQWAQGSHQTL